MEGLIELKNSFNKKNQKNEDQIKKKKFDWMMKLKEKKFRQSSKDKIRNLKNEDWNEKSSIWENCN